MSDYSKKQSFKECKIAEEKMDILIVKRQKAWEIEQEAQQKYSFACDNRKQIKEDITRLEGVIEFWMRKNDDAVQNEK